MSVREFGFAIQEEGGTPEICPNLEMDIITEKA